MAAGEIWYRVKRRVNVHKVVLDAGDSTDISVRNYWAARKQPESDDVARRYGDAMPVCSIWYLAPTHCWIGYAKPPGIDSPVSGGMMRPHAYFR
jgi:hypothetical protein